MSDHQPQEEMVGICCSAMLIPVGFFIAAITSVAIALATGILKVDAFTAALYVFGLQVLFLALFTITYALRSNE